MTEENPTPTPTPADIAPKPQEPVATAPETPAAPPWGDEFNAEKAWNLVQNLRADKEKLQQRPILSDEQKNKLSEYDKLVAASQTELEKAQAAAQKNAEQAQAYLTAAVKAKIEALATGFADPSDAVSQLNPADYADESGAIDSDGIKAALAGILERKPHWAKAPETRLPVPNPAQGSSGSGTGVVPQLSEQDVQRMYREKDYEGIDKARSEGRLNDVLGIK